MDAIADRIATLSPEKRALLLEKLNQSKRRPEAPTRPAVRPRERVAGSLPLSFGQQRMWFMDQFEPGNPAYNIPMALRLAGDLNIAALKGSLGAIAGRHEALRTTYATIDQRPFQQAAPALDLELPVADVPGADAPEREAQALRMAAAEVRRPFDLALGPPIRAMLLRLSEREHILVVTTHHIVSDGWSMSVLTHELTTLYEAFCAGRPSPLPELPIQYADYAAWQQELIQGEELQRQLGYWEKQLRGAPALLDLPTDRPRPATQTYAGASHLFKLPLALADGMRKLSQREGVTLFMTLLSAFQTLLYRYTGQGDIVVGTPIANRTQAEVEQLIGFFVNTLALRTQLDDNPSFRALLKRVREMALAAYAHQDLPFEKLVEALQLERNLSHTPLVQVLFALQNVPPEDLRLPGLTASWVEVDPGAAQFDLSLYVWETPRGLDCRLEYNTDLFDQATVARMADHFQNLLAGILAGPELPVASLPLLSAGEREQLLVGWNSTAVDYPRDVCLHRLFEAQVERTPGAIAVVYEGQALTYAELNARANQLARHLRERGIGPDTLVGVCAARSLELVVALYAILKAGGAYLPLDPGYPADRLQFMIADGQAPVLLTQQDLIATLPPHSAQVIRLDADWPEIARQPAENLEAGAAAGDLAYVIYTSGSTGRPKGVQIEHRSIVNRLLWMQDEYRLDASDRVLQKTPFSFDVSVWEFFWPLLVGAQLVVARPDGHKDPDYLAELIQQEQITTMHFVPPMLGVFLGQAGAAQCRSLRRVFCSGEALPYDLQERFFATYAACELHNLYGPTEAAVDVSYWACRRGDARQLVPIGFPVANTQLYVLDSQLQPTPIGVAGELYLGGVQLARGYLNRPELTEEKFIPNPFWKDEGGRMNGEASAIDGAPSAFSLHTSPRLYRTGDSARFLPDGSVEYLSRLDQQVKLRGFRIELGEIEAVLAQHAGVREAVVLVREDTPGDKRLVAYLVPTSDGQQTVEAASPSSIVGELRAFLKDRLPDYMVPVAFVTLEAFPLTPSGKIDRRALPAPSFERSGPRAEIVAPRTPLEQRIAAVWSEVLGIEQIGIDDNFFELGGESFKAVQVVRKIDASVAVIDLFKSPTVRGLAERLERGQPKQNGLLHRLTPATSAKPVASLVCVPFAGGSAISYQPLAAALPAGHALYALELPGHDYSRRDEPLVPLEELARRCAEEIRRDVPGPIALYGHCAGGGLTLAVARLLEEAQVELAGVFIGGHFPTPRLPGRLFELLAQLFPVDRWTARRTALETLRAGGFFTEVTDPGEQEFVVRNFLHDARASEDYYTSAYKAPEAVRLRAPLVCVIGERDRVTELYEERHREWEFFSDAVELRVIPGAGHYFMKHQAKEVAQIVTDQWAAWRSPAGAPAAKAPARTAGRAAPVSAAIDTPPARAAQPSLLTFLLIALGQFVSMIGTGLTAFAAGMWVYQQTGSVSAFAGIAVAALLPAILLAPVAGAVADRWDRRIIMLLSDTFAACGTLALVLLLWTGALQIWHIYVIASMGAVANAFQQPAYMAAISQLVPKRYYGRANGIVQLGGATSSILAPLLGGILVLMIGLHGIVLIDVVTFLFAVTVTALVRFPNTLFKRREEPFLRELAGGWRYIRRRHGLLAIAAFTVAINYLLSLVEVLTPPLVLSLGSTATLGMTLAASGAGLLVGSLAMSVWGGTRRRTDGIIASVLVLSLSMLMIGLAPAPIFPIIGLFGIGLATALVNAHWLSIVQMKVGLELQGRVMATNLMLVWSMMPLGYLSAGPLADRIFEPLMAVGGPLAGSVGQLIGAGPGRGIALLMIVAGLIALLFTALAYAYRPIRRLEDDLPDAVVDAVIDADKDQLQAQADRRLSLPAAAPAQAEYAPR